MDLGPGFKPTIPLSFHLCGQPLRDLLAQGETPLYPALMMLFKRIQLNFHGEPQAVNKDAFKDGLLCLDREIIFQIDGGMGRELYGNALTWGVNVVPFFDLSHGAGVLPEKWDAPMAPWGGYAGGLGPDNLQEQLPAILKATTGNGDIWIDLETHARTDGDLDINKVKTCLQIASKYVQVTEE